MKRASEKNERFVVDRRGEPAVVIMSIKDFIDTIAPPPAWLKKVQAESERKGTARLSMRAINAEIAAYRKEKSAGKRKKQPNHQPR